MFSRETESIEFNYLLLELAYTIMVTDKSPRTAVSKLENQIVNDVDLVPKLAALRPRKKRYFHFSLKAGESLHPTPKAVRQEEFPFIWRKVSHLFYSDL